MKICEEWQAALTERIKKEIEEGTLDKDVKYSSGKSKKFRFIDLSFLIVRYQNPSVLKSREPMA